MLIVEERNFRNSGRCTINGTNTAALVSGKKKSGANSNF